jgi:hypothetical protein
LLSNQIIDKPILIANAIQHLQKAEPCVVFVFLNQGEASGDLVRVLHSMLFQIAEDTPSVRSDLIRASKSDKRRLASDPEYVEKLFQRVIQSLGPTFIAVDGLDEVDEMVRGSLLRALSEVLKSFQNTKMVIGSREESDIERALNGKATAIRVDHNNLLDIQKYVNNEIGKLLLKFEGPGADEAIRSEVTHSLNSVAAKAQGSLHSLRRYALT